MHALQEFNIVHPEVARRWHKDSNHLGFLSVANEQELEALHTKAQYAGLYTAAFTEPDLGDSLTAIVIEPGDKSRRLVSSLRLAMRDRAPQTEPERNRHVVEP